MKDETKLFWASADCLRVNAYKKIIEFYGDLDAAKDAILDPKKSVLLLKHDLQQIGIQQKSIEKILEKTKKVDLPQQEENLKKYGAIVLCHDDEEFPHSLKNIDDAPVFLFAKGDFSKLTRKSLAVVGSRTITNEGKWACSHLLPELSQAGFTIVSGMALGIDTLAHKEAIKHGSPTVAFWGTGLDIVYPSVNQKLALEIMQNGVVFSEFPFGTSPTPYNFPRRNRLVSGYSDGVLVVEGKEKSGSLITAQFAMEQGKDVFAVPGPIRSPLSRGPHKLIQEGAKLVQYASDVLEAFGVTQNSLFAQENVHQCLPKNADEKNVYNVLSYSAMHFDEIVRKTTISAPKLSSILMMMSLSGAVEELSSAGWVRR
ncbi:TPA: DNA-protecting protein DprA [Candidatus Gracilibacteria bacterium]|nr:DNA-protecting protein DprA [Candidatus Peregrinibacteria bacterium]HIQ56813.1 DNA-protecting protein DprA [Candidatus Gracilibacteria bacterium]HIQ57158.1 DNA-protecting protein DprA [Candidatus Gracilibacteria bacterium]